MKNKILLISTSIILFIFGFNYYSNFQEFLLSFIPNMEVHYLKLLTQFLQSFFFGFTLSIIPILTYFLWHKFKIEKEKIFYYISSLVIASIIALILRTQSLIFIYKIPFSKTVISESQNGIIANRPFYQGEDLNYPLFIFLAVLLTSTIWYFMLNKNKNDYS